MTIEEKDIYIIVANALECQLESLKPDTGLHKHPDWDSLGQIQIIIALEQGLSININDDKILDFTDMSSIIRFCKDNNFLKTPN